MRPRERGGPDRGRPVVGALRASALLAGLVQEILRRPAVAARVAAVREAGPPPVAMPGPDRKQLLELVGA